MPTTANSTLPPIPPHVGALTGPRIMGYLFHWGLFGMLCVQVYLYHIAFPKDPLRNKIFVYSVFTLELMQTVILTEIAFRVFGDGYGDFEVFNAVSLSWFSIPFISGLVAFIAQAFYAFRITILAKSYGIAAVILSLASIQLGGAIGTSVVMKHARLFSRLLSRDFSITIGIWNGASALCDIIIAVCMTYHLSRRRSGAIQTTSIRLQRVIRLVIETGTISAFVAVLNLILSTLPGKSSYFLVTAETLAKIYSNSMMVVLNSRIRLGEDSVSWVSGVSNATTVSRVVNSEVARRGGSEAYELGGGVVVTKEEVVFPSTESNDEFFKGGKEYLV